MKKRVSVGIVVAAAVIFYGGTLSGCNNSPYYGSAGATGIDTVNKLPGLSLVTTDPSLIPAATFPGNGDTGISLHAYDSNAIKPIVRWHAASGATHYRVVISAGKVSVPGNSSETLLALPLVIDDTAFTGTDSSDSIRALLSYSTSYYLAICAKNDSGKVGWSPIRTFKTKADPLPQLQAAYVNQKFGMFIHFNMSTFSRYNDPTPSGEWETGAEDPNLFQPESLNVGQWADVAKSAHCTYAVLTSKHHGGFCLWPYSGYVSSSLHGIAQGSWYQQNGKRDIIREFVDSVRQRGLDPGLYFSIRDEHNPPNIPMVKAQLTDLLSNYGDLKVIWFDGWGWYVGYVTIPYDTVANLVQYLNDSLGHHTIIVENNHMYKMVNTQIVEYEIPIDGPPLAKNGQPSEGNEPIRADKCWFWHPMDTTLKSTQSVLDRITAANAAYATYLLDVTPDTLGRVPQYEVQAMSDIGAQAIAQGILQH